jgi:hypothetical protein
MEQKQSIQAYLSHEARHGAFSPARLRAGGEEKAPKSTIVMAGVVI